MKKILPSLILSGLVLFTRLPGAQANTGETSAAASGQEKKWSSVRSPDRNFVVMDMPSRDALAVMVWAGTVNQRLSDWAHGPVPGNFVYPLVINAVVNDDEKTGRVLKAQVYSDDGHLRQKMTMVNPAEMDQEDALEALCHLLLNRWIHSRPRKAGNREEYAEYPLWFAVGVAQNIYPELADRNYKARRKSELNGNYMPASEIFSFTYSPPGRWPEKAHAGLVMAWMTGLVGASKLMDQTADRLARREKLDEHFILDLLGFSSRREMNVAWDLWMARQDQRIVPGVVSSDTESLVRILEMRAADFGLVHPGLPPDGRVPPQLLIEKRSEPWAREFCQAVSWRLHQESIGKTPEIRKHIQSFMNFYNSMIHPPEKKPGKRKPGKVTTRGLSRAWREASKEWVAFLELEQSRRAYLDHYEQSQTTPPEPAARELQKMMIKWDAAAPQ